MNVDLEETWYTPDKRFPSNEGGVTLWVETDTVVGMFRTQRLLSGQPYSAERFLGNGAGMG